MSYTLSPTLLREIERDLEPRIERAAKKGAEILKANVGSTSHGAGRKYSNLPNVSSAPGQFPVRQEGDLEASVQANPSNDPLVWEVGFFGEPLSKLLNLEFAPSSQGGRQPLARVFEDNAVLEEMEKALGG